MKSSIVPKPPGVGLLQSCPSCKRRFALERTASEKRGEVMVETYRCKHCGHQVEHADRHPRGSV